MVIPLVTIGSIMSTIRHRIVVTTWTGMRIATGTISVAQTTRVARSAPFCVVSATAPTVIISIALLIRNDRMRETATMAASGISPAAEMDTRVKPPTRLSSVSVISQSREISTSTLPTMACRPTQGNLTTNFSSTTPITVIAQRAMKMRLTRLLVSISGAPATRPKTTPSRI